MTKYSVKIRNEIEKVCANDKILKEFVVELISLDNVSHYKKKYNELIEKYTFMLGEKNED